MFLFIFLLNSPSAFAHREDYLNETLVFVTLEKGEIEPEYWFDLGRHSDTKIDFIRHHVAVEYGITDQWMVDGRVTLEDEEHEKPDFKSGRFETRYRFGEEGENPIDVAISGEVNTERDEEGSQQPGIEPRLILSKDFDQLNLTLNLPLEILLDSGSTEFIPSFGARYNATKLLRLGSELKYNADAHEGSIVPQIWFALPHEVTIKIGYSFGFDDNQEEFGRIALEAGF